MKSLSYVLPLRAQDDADLAELTGYLWWVAARAETIVVDSSPAEIFDLHASRWAEFVRHVRPDPRFRFLMPKVNGVLTGVELATHEKVIVADDDVRYDEDPMMRVGAMLDEAELVWPQNYFDPLPWHARWDTARSLLNRAIGRDYPGTVGLRRSFLLDAGGYDGDVMFENLELRRTIEEAGGRIAEPLDLYVRRLPPSTDHFLSQRVRQAYDDLALPARLGTFLAVVPAVAIAVAKKRRDLVGAAALAAVGLAELGRNRAGGRRVFPTTSSLWAPAWVAERAITSWLAIGQRVAFGGVSYRGTRIRRAASSRRVSVWTSGRGGSGRRDRARAPRRS
jgi:hypothetical protein